MSRPRADTSQHIAWSAEQVPDLRGRTAVVTGAASGLGLQVARTLADCGARVVMAVRDTAKGYRARNSLVEQDGVRPDQIEVGALDLLDLPSARRFAAAATERTPALDLLVLNAGISSQPHRLSAQGVESQFATNHLGHFALTGLMLPLLTAGHAPRVVTVTSALYRRARLDAGNIASLAQTRNYSPGRAYARSKLANVLFARELQHRLSAAGSPVRSFTAHPGMARTPLHDTYPSARLRLATRAVAALIARPAEQAVLPILFAATAPDADPDAFYGPTGSRQHPAVTAGTLGGPALDTANAAALWATSEQLSGVAYPLAAQSTPHAADRGGSTTDVVQQE